MGNQYLSSKVIKLHIPLQLQQNVSQTMPLAELQNPQNEKTLKFFEYMKSASESASVIPHLLSKYHICDFPSFFDLPRLQTIVCICASAFAVINHRCGPASMFRLPHLRTLAPQPTSLLQLLVYISGLASATLTDAMKPVPANLSK